jgi:hypothetical protein
VNRERRWHGRLGWRNEATVAARGSVGAHGHERERGGAATDERAEWEIFFQHRKRMEKFLFRPVPFSTFVHSFSYLRGPVSIFTEMGEGFYRPFPRDPIFTRN